MTQYEKCQQSGDTSIHDRFMYIGQTGSGDVEIPLTGRQIKSICTSGSNDEAVSAVCKNKRVRESIRQYSEFAIMKALKEYGTWDDEELKDHEKNVERLVWVLAWDVFDSENPNDYLAIEELQA